MTLASMSANSGLRPMAVCSSSASIENTVQSPRAVADALRGRPLITAISPKISPFLTVSSGRGPMVSSTSPPATKYTRLGALKSPPLVTFSSSTKIACPLPKRSSRPDARNIISAAPEL